MVDPKALLADLKKLRRALETDIRENTVGGPDEAAVRAEWHEAFDAKRTADTFETFFTAAIDQSVVHWILAVVFLRFLEDNRLCDGPLISGPGERLELAQARQAAYVRLHPLHTDADYLLATFAETARLPSLPGLYDPVHNPLFRLPLSGDGAMALLAFFRDRSLETGTLRHDFTDPDWNTRFLGDLYQDLSELAKKRYALLQTPEFVQDWILDRTLDPAMREFGPTQARMIDPTCGSGHFLLGGFARILAAWRRDAPEMPPAAQAQRALDAVAGVDLNPFAVEIARFRLLLAALQAAGETRLAAAPDFRFQLAVGDSLLHGRHFGLQVDLAHQKDAIFQRRLRHHYADEDTSAVDAILGRQYHAVVGNPPYITPKDPAMRDAYRELYVSCHMKYGLGAPFTERFFDLAVTAGTDKPAGFVGLIVANSFMKREFGSRLIEKVLPRLDLTHVVDCSGAYIPGHGTPTVIVFGRNQGPVSSVVRTVRGIRGEPATPADPALGLVWSAILEQADLTESTSEFISTEDTPRAILEQHPWNIGGGGASEVQQFIEEDRITLGSIANAIGITAVTGEDDAYTFEYKRAATRLGIQHLMPLVEGDAIRDYRIVAPIWSVWPHGHDFEVLPLSEIPDLAKYLWPVRSLISKRRRFGTPMLEKGLSWYEFQEIYAPKLRAPLSITFADMATHNHFVLDRIGNVYKQSSPVIQLKENKTNNDYFGILGLLNSSTSCFWLKQVCYNKGATVDSQGARQRTEPFEDFYQLNSTRIGNFPLAQIPPVELAIALDTEARRFASNLPPAEAARSTPSADNLKAAREVAAAARGSMIALQEELDWRCYQLYGLIDDAPEYQAPPRLRLGERAFEIVLARRIADGSLESTWFTRHNSIPITDLPTEWPDDYRAVVQRRIALIESDSTIALIERPEFKRRWVMQSWEDMERDALRIWLLDRLEDPLYWPPGEARVVSTNALADATRRDSDFQQVAALYTGGEAFDLEALVAALVDREHVPFMAALRYTATGLRKQADWEAIWARQRQEDSIDAELAATRPARLHRIAAMMTARRETESEAAYQARVNAEAKDVMIGRMVNKEIAEQVAKRKAAEVGAIPVPPKYKTADFLSVDIWRLRGGLDVPKERFVSFPHCARDADGSLPILWAGYDHLARAKAIAAYFVERKDVDGWPADRLIPLLAGLQELVPWLRQWHNEVDAEAGLRMGDYFAQLVEDEARDLGLTLADLASWTPPPPVRRTRGRRAMA